MFLSVSIPDQSPPARSRLPPPSPVSPTMTTSTLIFVTFLLDLSNVFRFEVVLAFVTIQIKESHIFLNALHTQREVSLLIYLFTLLFCAITPEKLAYCEVCLLTFPKFTDFFPLPRKACIKSQQICEIPKKLRAHVEKKV